MTSAASLQTKGPKLGTPSDFGDVLRRLRAARSLSGRALARKATLTATAVSHFETGRRVPVPAVVSKLADALGVPRELLLWFAYSQAPQDSLLREPFDAVARLMSTQLDQHATPHVAKR